MRAFRTSTAGIGLAALGALGLCAVATPSFAQINQPFFGWYAFGSPNGPIVPNGSVYAQQAVALAQASGQTLDLPGGITYQTQHFNATGGQGIIAIQLPQNYHLAPGFCPTASQVTTDGGGGFTSVLSVGCYTVTPTNNVPLFNSNLLPTNGDVIEIQVALASATPNTTGSIHLDVIKLDGTSIGLNTLNPPGTLLNNPDKTTQWCTGASFNPNNCELFGSVLQSPAGIFTTPAGGYSSVLMATSINAKGVKTFPPSYSGYKAVCVDMTYAWAPGEEFREGTNCESGADQSVADKGMIQIDLLALEAQHENTHDTLTFRDPEGPVIIVQGRCGGLMLENIGSIAASCGLQPFTGENAYLVPVDVNGQNFPETPMQQLPVGSLPSFTNPHTACPVPDASGAGHPPAGTKGAIKGTVGPAGTVTFDLTSVTTGADYEPPFPPSQLPDGTDWVAYYEFCDYATEQAVIADSAGWFVSAQFDCLPTLKLSCTKTMENPAMDALLPIQVNGAAFYVNFTNGAYNQLAFLRIVNDMHDVNPNAGNPNDPANVNETCVKDNNQDAYNAGLNPTPGSIATCEPVAQVICKVTTDTGFNGYASLFTNSGGAAPSNGPGLVTGTNDLYPVWEIFANAGVPQGPFSDPNNVYNFGSLICFHPYGVYITQVQLDSNGSVVNIK
jgi:hypothetical protein